MTKLAKQLLCVCMRNGVQLWHEKERIEKLQSILEKSTGHHFITFDDQTINTADIVGIFSADTMQDLNRRKNGQWQCHVGTWHDKQNKYLLRVQQMNANYSPK